MKGRLLVHAFEYFPPQVLNLVLKLLVSSPLDTAHPISRKTPSELDVSRPLLSVIIPCYNHGHYLGEAVDSILGQTLQDVEIIVVDDGSDDPDTRRSLSEFQRPRTKLISHQKNRGLPAARNSGITHARGKYICCLDADDKLHPTYLEKCLCLLEANHGIDFVYSWTQVFGQEERVWHAPQFDPEEIIHYNQLNPPAVFRRKVWQVVGGFREEMDRGYEDWEFWIRLTRNGSRGYRIPEKLIFVRRVGKSFIHRAQDRHQELVNQIQDLNPDIYRDLSWLQEVKANYREVYAHPFQINLDRSGSFSRFEQPVLGWNGASEDRLQRDLDKIIAVIHMHGGDFIFISLRPLGEDVLDTLFSQTPYVYVLPHFLPRFTWRPFLNELMIEDRKVQPVCWQNQPEKQ